MSKEMLLCQKTDANHPCQARERSKVKKNHNMKKLENVTGVAIESETFLKI